MGVVFCVLYVVLHSTGRAYPMLFDSQWPLYIAMCVTGQLIGLLPPGTGQVQVLITPSCEYSKKNMRTKLLCDWQEVQASYHSVARCNCCLMRQVGNSLHPSSGCLVFAPALPPAHTIHMHTGEAPVRTCFLFKRCLYHGFGHNRCGLHISPRFLSRKIHEWRTTVC